MCGKKAVVQIYKNKIWFAKETGNETSYYTYCYIIWIVKGFSFIGN